MKKLIAVALASLVLVGCNDDKPKAPSVDLNYVSNVCANMTKTYIQNQAEKKFIGDKVRFMRYEGLDELIERQCKLTSMRMRNEAAPELTRKLGEELILDVEEFAKEQMTYEAGVTVKNTVGLAERYAGKIAQSKNKYEVESWIEKIKETQ